MSAVVVSLFGGANTEPLAASDVLVSVEIRREVNRLPGARLVFLDGDIAARTFELSGDARLAPGAKLVVKARYEGEVDVQLFAGVIVRHRIEARGTRSELHVELKDAAIKLTSPRKSAIYRKQRDDELLSQMIEDAGLKVEHFPRTPVTHAELVRYQASDWDFLLMRADVLGLCVRVVDGAIAAFAMDEAPPGASELELRLGIDEIFSVELELDGSHQHDTLRGQAWDPKTNEATDVVTAATVDPLIGSPKAAAVADALGIASDTLESWVPLAEGELQAWADARMARSRMAMVRGRVELPGRGGPEPLERVKLDGVGSRFEGTAMIGAVTQRIDLDGWRTELELGVSPDVFAREPDIAQVPAAGLLPPVSGLQIAVVADFEQDTAGGGHRVKVTLPGVDTTDGAIWARVAWPDAGKDRGLLSWPTPGDEVVLGFLNDDPRQAVVLGSLYGSLNTPPEIVGPPSEDNFRKAFVSAQGVTIGVDDERPAVFVHTRDKKNMIELDAKAKTIEVRDEHGNTITMNSDGVSIETGGALTFKAKGAVTIKGASVDLARS